MYDNNIGAISITLSKTLGNTTSSTITNINIISGQIDIGFIVFDNDGTMGICTNINNSDPNNVIYTFTTRVINAEVDVAYLLSIGY